MISEIKNVLLVLIITSFALSACGGPTPAAKPAITNTNVVIASATVLAATEEIPTATATETNTPSAPIQTVISTGISYINDVLPIFKSRCANCHGTNNPREGLTITTYDGLMAGSKNGLVVKPGDPDNSLLIKQIRDGEMPKRGPKLTPEQLQILVDWILQGALNN